jgi:hypothetical protein
MVITLYVTRADTHKIAMNNRTNDPSFSVDIHYSAFKRVQRYSKIAFEPENTYGGRPTKYEGLGTNRKPYRTLEEMELT